MLEDKNKIIYFSIKHNNILLFVFTYWRQVVRSLDLRQAILTRNFKIDYMYCLLNYFINLHIKLFRG